jgi:hypothetical protein
MFSKQIYFADSNGKTDIDYPPLNDIKLTDDYFKQFIDTSGNANRQG